MFHDRKEAGLQLAQKLLNYQDQGDVLILALPRGGVPVAYEVAKILNLELDVFLVRKIGIPGHEETAIGAIATGGIEILNDELIQYLNIPWIKIQNVIEKEKKELEYRNQLYRGGSSKINLENRTIILIDDGMATGSTMKAAITALTNQGADNIIVAIPVSSHSAYNEIIKEADDVICISLPDPFEAVGEWYLEFPQVSHDEVRKLLAQFRKKS